MARRPPYLMPAEGQLVYRFDHPAAIVGNAVTAPDAALVQTGGARMAFFYRGGSLFLGHFDSDKVLRYDHVDAAQGSQPVTWSAMIGVNVFHVASITVDASGRFWLATNDQVGRYPDLGELADGSAVTPNVVISHDHRTPAPFNATAVD